MNLNFSINKYDESSQLIILASVILLLDRPIQYLIESILRVSLPTNLLVVGIVFYIIMANKIVLKISKFSLFGITSIIVGYFIGTIYHDEFSILEVYSAIIIFIPFYLGYQFSEKIKINEGLYIKFLMASSVFITLTSLLAIPLSLLPVKYQLHLVDDSIFPRPEIFTDQNFHIMYVFWTVSLIIVCNSYTKKLLITFLGFSAFFYLAAVQTRSGIVYYILTVAITFWAITNKKKLTIYLIGIMLSIFCLALFSEALIDFLETTDIYKRFHKGNDSTSSHRLHSFMFLFQNLFEFKYWLPYGNSEFTAAYGGVPHSNITAVYLTGGILSLLGYFCLVLLPASVCLYRILIKRSQANISYFLSINVVLMLFIQLSLNLPFNEQVWFWAGVGASLTSNIRLRPHRRFSL